MNNNQDGAKMASSTCGHSNLVISYMDYFHQMLAQVRTRVLSHNQDGHQNGHHVSVCTCGCLSPDIY